MRDEMFKNALFAKEKFKEHLSYWTEVTAGELKPTDLPRDFRHGKESERTTGETYLEFPAELTKKLWNFFKENSALTLYILLLAAFKTLLFRHTRSDEVLILSPPLSKTPQSRNTRYNQKVLFRDVVDTGLTFKELVLKTKEQVVKAFKYQEYPLDLVFKKRNINIDDLPFIHKIIFLADNLQDMDDVKHLDYDLLFALSNKGTGFSGKMKYDKRFYKEDTIEAFAKRYIRVLAQCTDDVNRKIENLQLLTEAETHRLLVEFNGTESGYPRHKTIHQLFEERARTSPDRTALVSGENALTYNELNQRANQVANLLRCKGVEPENIVGIMLDNSMEMIIGILGILKAGAAYLPINPYYPQGRVASMLNDSSAKMLLTSEQISQLFDFMALQYGEAKTVKPYVTASRPMVTDLDGLQFPDRSLIDYEKYSPYIGQSMMRNSVTFHFSRGCMFDCAYCFKIWPNRKYANRSGENMFEELLLYYKMGVRRFSFVDDLPNFNIKESAKFYQLIVKNRLQLQIYYPNGIRGDILTPDYIDLMVEAGTVSLDVALETTSKRLQRLVQKNLNLERLEENIKYILSRHPHVILETQLLHGIPDETEEEARVSLDFLKGLKWIHFPYLHVLKIYPNTDMAQIAMAHGVSREAIEQSDNLGYNELPETLPFPKNFTRKYQAEFVSDYFMAKERLLHVLPFQMKVLTESEIAQKYDSYLPVKINSVRDLLAYAGIGEDELEVKCVPEDYYKVPDLNRKIRTAFPVKKPAKKALRILMLDLSAYFSSDRREVIYDVVEPPLGLIYLLTHLDKQFGPKINRKIMASRIDFDSFDELKQEVAEFKPDIIGIRTLNFFKEFFHKTVSLLRQWQVDVPIVAGGPYATSSCSRMLADDNIDLAVLGEGEITFAQLIDTIIANDGKLPGEKELKQIPGIAFVEQKNRLNRQAANREILFLDKIPEVLAGQPVENPKPLNQAGDLAYIIYTSGTSGTPKGVMNQHNNLVNQVSGLIGTFDLDDSLHYLLLASFTFDVSLMHIFSSLTSGGKLHLIPDEIKKDPIKFWEFVHIHNINLLNIVPAFMNILLEDVEKKKIAFKYLFVGGDVFTPMLYHRLRETFNIEEAINIYGPTETTINATLYRCKNDENGESIPIGKPLRNYKIYILDRDLNPVPPGVKGELYISGDGVARGYLNNPELTVEKFIDPDKLNSPYRSNKLYRTGDLVRILPSGDIRFLGRVDRQVKVRGFRIELGEIENRLLSHARVKDTVVIAREDKNGEKYLCAYVVFTAGEALTTTELREYLSRELPDHMVPSHFVTLDRLPLDPTGKVDRKKCPAPEAKAGENYSPPRDEVEKKLVQLWAEVLGVEEAGIGIDSDFFELGGHSLKATILVSKIHKAFDVQVPVIEVFKTPTIRGLAGYIKKEAPEVRFESIEPVEKKEYYPLSSAQKRLYILQQMEPTTTSYNLPLITMLPGTIDGETLTEAFRGLIKRHESFRTSFQMVAEQPVQRIHDDVSFEIKYLQPNNSKSAVEQGAGLEDVKKIVKGFVKPFDLSRAPLMRAAMIKLAKGYVLLVDMHHILTDGISNTIIKKDILALYRKETPEALTIQYKDFSQWQNKLLMSPGIKKQETYWLEEFKGEVPLLDLPADHPRPQIRSFEGAAVNFELGLNETMALKQLAREEGATLFMVVLALYYVFLFKISGQEDIVIGTPIAGRRHADLEKIVGMFVNTLALRNYPTKDKTFAGFLTEVKQKTLNSFENQDCQFESLVEKMGIKREGNRNPLFDVMFSLHNLEVVPGKKVDPDVLGWKQNPYRYEYRTSLFDLSLDGVELGNNLVFTFEYSSELFEKKTINRFLDYFKEILDAVIKNKDIRLGDIEVSHHLTTSKPRNSRVVFKF